MKLDFAAFSERVGLRRKLLVVVPHPDDETLGCGGLIALARQAGIAVNVVLVTDGGASHPHSVKWPRGRLASQRLTEFREALHVLGVDAEAVALGLPDAETETLPQRAIELAIERLRDEIAASAPDIIATTWRPVPHCDHRFSYA